MTVADRDKEEIRGLLGEATAARLQERVAGLSSDFSALRQVTLELDRKIEKSQSDLSQNLETSLAAFGTRFETAVAGLNAKVDERGRIPWAGYGILISVVTVLGGLAYLPISSKQQDLAGLIALDQSTAEKSSDHQEKAIERLEARVVPRGEHEEKWRSFESQQSDLKAAITVATTNLQRQIDDISRRSADTFSLHDVLAEDKSHMAALDKALNEILQKLPIQR